MEYALCTIMSKERGKADKLRYDSKAATPLVSIHDPEQTIQREKREREREEKEIWYKAKVVDDESWGRIAWDVGRRM